MNWNANSKLCQLLLGHDYRRIYVNYAKLPQNKKRRKAMLKLAREAEKTSMGKP